jgi:hypothetical protein
MVSCAMMSSRMLVYCDMSQLMLQKLQARMISWSTIQTSLFQKQQVSAQVHFLEIITD